MATLANPYQTYHNINNWLHPLALMIVIFTALGASFAAIGVSLSLEVQFDSGVVVFVGLLSIFGALAFLITLGESLEVSAGVSTVVAVILWLITGVGLAINPKTVSIEPNSTVMHVMPDGAVHFPGSSYKRILMPDNLGDTVPLVYETSIYYDTKQALGETGKEVTLRTTKTITVRYAKNSFLAEKIREWSKQENVSIQKTLLSRASAQPFISQFRNEHPGVEIKEGTRLPTNRREIESVVVTKVTEEIV